MGLKVENYDFSGWATRNNLKCTDGRIIRQNAFKDNDGAKVPLVWMHQSQDVSNVLGHAILENRDDGVYAYCSFNDSPKAKYAKTALLHGDIDSLSIWANNLVQKGRDVLHGAIKEVSMVVAGANPGAFIDSVIAHGAETDSEAIIYTGEPIFIAHSDDFDEDDEDEYLKHSDKDVKNDNGKDDEENTEDDEENTEDDKETLKEVFDTLTNKQKKCVCALVGLTVQDKEKKNENDDSEEGGKEEMKHNVFDKSNPDVSQNVLSHSAQVDILKLAKTSSVGSFKEALEMYAADNGLELQHADAASSGFVQSGDGNVTLLFPEYKDVRPGAPELVTNDQGWISLVMKKVHKSPISRIRTSQVDIRNIDTLRAKGYQKGKKKSQTGNFDLVRRTTDPQTVYVKSALHRDDIIDITDFDYVEYLYNIDRLMLNEEMATAIMLGDGRDDGDEAKIMPDKIRPIWLDDELYTIHAEIDLTKAKKELQGTETGSYFGENYVYAEAMIETALHAREKYKGTGTPDYYCTPYALNCMLLARDRNGRRIFGSVTELASALNVGSIVTAEQFEGKVRTTSDSKKKKLHGMFVNLADYSLGATKGGEISHFTQFDIDFNQQKSLIETRVSGALTRIKSAIVIEEDVTPTQNTPSGSEEGTV